MLSGSRTLPHAAGCRLYRSQHLRAGLNPATAPASSRARVGMESRETLGTHPVAPPPSTSLRPGKPFARPQRQWVRWGGCVGARVSAAALRLRRVSQHLGTDSGGAALGLKFQSQECQRCLPNCSAWHKFLPNPQSGTFFGFVPFVTILFCDLLFLKLLNTSLKLFLSSCPLFLKWC